MERRVKIKGHSEELGGELGLLVGEEEIGMRGGYSRGSLKVMERFVL